MSIYGSRKNRSNMWFLLPVLFHSLGIAAFVFVGLSSSNYEIFQHLMVVGTFALLSGPIGGAIAYLILEGDDMKKAKNCLIVGFGLTGAGVLFFAVTFLGRPLCKIYHLRLFFVSFF